MSDLVVDYAQNPIDWEGWFFEYVYGGFYIFPPFEVSRPIDELRKKFDPKSDRYCQAHISLSGPLGQPLTNELLAEIEAAIKYIEPYEISYGPLITFPPHPGVCFDVRPADKFFDLRKAVHGCSAFTGSDVSRKSIPPHITIAEFGLTYDASEELRKTLNKTVPEGKFWCDSIEYAVPNDNFYFERRLRIPLGKSA